MNAEQWKFINNEFLHSSIIAALRRSGTYSKTAKASQRSKFREALTHQLMELSEKYREEVSGSEHIKNIELLADELSDRYKEVLKGGRFRIGIAQKALNCYLKYLWCIGRISTPPHCTFDSIIISKLKDCKEVRWTLLDKVSKYRALVEAAREEAGENTLAQWELEVWNREA